MKIRRLTPENVSASVPGLADLLVDCVTGGASVGFMEPMTAAKAAGFWESVAADVAERQRVVLVAEEDDGRIVGTVQLVLSVPENQDHRADVAKMLVRRDVRRRGIAQQLMHAIETIAREEGRSVLVLDTVTGSDAERLYQRAGWHRVGDVPNFARMPDGPFCSTTYYYKQL